MIDDILAQLFDEELQSRAKLFDEQLKSRTVLGHILSGNERQYRSKDAEAAQAAAAQAAARADLLAEMERRVIGCADDWEDYRYASWASAADDTLAQATAATADADWLRAMAQEWDAREQMMGSRRGYRTEPLLQRMDEYYYGDRSGQATWACAAQAVLAESGGIESWATQWLLGVAQDRDRAAQAANSPFLHVPQWLLDYAQDGDTQDAQDADAQIAQGGA